jgi:NAD(P)-dependent dehydrogenase (short-subunit alcohol dehydrogenase family)
MQKRIFITGASRGIGAATALYLAQQGCRVVGTTRDVSRLGDDAPSHQNITYISMDVTDVDSIKNAVSRAREEMGGIDVLINNAGISHMGPFEEMPDEQGRAIFETNFFGLINMIKATLPVLREAGGGQILNVSSLGGRVGVPFQSYYVSSKFALEGWSEAARMELKTQGIDLVIVEPGDIKTDITSHHLLCESDSPHYKECYENACRSVRDNVAHAGPPEDVAKVIYKIINKKRPGVRYPAGKGAKMLSFLLMVVPDQLVERLVMKSYNVG